MKRLAAQVLSRGRALHDDTYAAEFVRSASMLAIWLAVRDAHRTVCDRDAVECDACRQYARAIAEARTSVGARVALPRPISDNGECMQPRKIPRPTQREAFEAAKVALKAAGLEMTPFGIATNERVIAGEITHDEAIALIIAHHRALNLVD